jgi:protein kinase A
METIRHPYIIKMFNSYQDARFIYSLLELVQGGELFSVIHERDVECLTEEDAKFYAYAISDALLYMHRGRYVYRDLKPENVMIDRKGYPVLVDFGFAKHVPDQTFTLCGKFYYFS